MIEFEVCPGDAIPLSFDKFMTALRKSVDRFFVPDRDQTSFWRIVGWWELRRITFTLLIFGITLAALLVYLFALVVNRQYEPDALMLLFPITIAANVFYTTGWIIDAVATKIFAERRPKFTVALLIGGLLLWLAPAMLWACLGIYGFIVVPFTK